ncbi:hypothetical protein, partial [Alicyclobacillus sendaiensis]|uniref:hypothetical protein n=1 Tax=Alicyclobacillus sendaiensis TaxID=192387 RepID=UPI0026F41F33
LKICWGYPRAGSSPAPGIAARFSAPFSFLPSRLPQKTSPICLPQFWFIHLEEVKLLSEFRYG